MSHTQDVIVDMRPGTFDKLCRTYDYIDKTTQLTGVCPNMREIARNLGVCMATVGYRLDLLYRLGWITDPHTNQWRAIGCVREPKIYYRQETE